MIKIWIPPRNTRILRALALHLPAAVLVLLFAVYPARAQFLVKQVDLTYLAQRADVIVHGRVVDVENEIMPGYENIPTVKVTLQVEDMMRGPKGDTYTFREVSVGIRARMGRKAYRTGQELLLFMTAPSEIGLSSPVGIEQGRFHIARNPEGSPLVINEQNNIGLFKNVAQAASMAGRPLTESQRRIASSEKGPVPLNEFVSIIENLMLMPRIR
jgi:hypothetical protein